MSLLSMVFAARAAPAAAAPESAYLGRWDLTLHAPGHEYPSWLELTDSDGTLRARLTSRWGHPRELPQSSLTDGHLRFISPKQEEDRKDDMIFDGQLVGGTLEGVTTGPDGEAWTWSGARAHAQAHRRAALGQAAALVQRQGSFRMAFGRSGRANPVDGRRRRDAQSGPRA